MLVFYTVVLALLLVIYIVYILIITLHIVSLIIEFIYNYIKASSQVIFYIS
jgi:hypothetical protein